MNAPYEAAQCPACKNWIRFEGAEPRFVEHQYGDNGRCYMSGQPVGDAPVETMDMEAL